MIGEWPRRVVGEGRSELGRRGQTARSWSARYDGEKWSEHGYLVRWRENELGRETVRMKNDLGFLKPLKRRGIFVIAGGRKKKNVWGIN